ncbi:MAG: U32 family peptidase, partial [Actinomycetota bacterium]|nr:U32 family peptidase [Actinomycetota bacterium]
MPAGGMNQLIAAINAGADSIYLGYKKYGARAYAENFDSDQLKEAVSIAHNYGIKVYLALNTLIKDSELRGVLDFLRQYTAICEDGIIIQDFYLYKIIKDLFDHIPVHASTQLNIHNIYSLKLMKRLGFKRAILAREMTLEEIKNLCKKKLTEIEIFAHGSQCYSYSGSCYFSSFISGKSGNRGKCLQPCRMKYK